MHDCKIDINEFVLRYFIFSISALNCYVMDVMNLLLKFKIK